MSSQNWELLAHDAVINRDEIKVKLYEVIEWALSAINDIESNSDDLDSNLKLPMVKCAEQMH